MSKKLLIFLIFIAIIALGFVIPKFEKTSTKCTQKFCSSSEPTAEVKCNSCAEVKPIFGYGIVWLDKACPGYEIMVFENSEHINSKDYTVIDRNICKYDFNFRIQKIRW